MLKKVLLLTVTPVIITAAKEVYEHIFSIKRVSVRKKRDCTKITPEMVEFIVERFNGWKGGEVDIHGHTQDHFAEYINSELGMDKSTSAIMKVVRRNTTEVDYKKVLRAVGW